MKELKYRQAIFVKGKFSYWHYWGFIEEHGNLTFVAPETDFSTIEEAYKNSYQYTRRKNNDKEIYEGDIIKAILPEYNIPGGMDYFGAEMDDIMPETIVIGTVKIRMSGGLGFTVQRIDSEQSLVKKGRFLKIKDEDIVIGDIIKNPEFIKEIKQNAKKRKRARR